MNDIDSIQESWNKKRIILGLIIICFFLVGAVYFFKKNNLDKEKIFQKSPLAGVKGVNINNPNNSEKNDTNQVSQKPVSLPLANELRDNIKQNIDSIRQEVSILKVEEIASSSPAVQKVLNEIKLLEQYPKNQAKDICQKVCDNFK